MLVFMGLAALWCAFALFVPPAAAVTVLGAALVGHALPPLFEIGPISLRALDAAAALLLASVTLAALAGMRVRMSRDWVQLFGPLAPWLIVTGLSLFVVANTQPETLTRSVVSYSRLVATVVLGAFVFLALQRREARQAYFLGFVAVNILNVLVTVIEWSPASADDVAIAGRYGGEVGVGTVGLSASLLAVFAVLAVKLSVHQALGIVAGLFSIVGFVLSKAGAAVLASSLVIGLIVATPNDVGAARTPVRKRASTAFVVVAGTALVLVGLKVVSKLRSNDAEGVLDMTGGSYAHRAMIAYAGLNIFLRNPFFGVGWQGAATESVVGDSVLNQELMNVFRELPRHYFYRSGISSLHNLYVQTLAECGLVGFASLMLAFYFIWRKVRSAVHAPALDLQTAFWLRYCAWCLLLLVIWWNANALFGGQLESVTAFSLLGALAALITGSASAPHAATASPVQLSAADPGIGAAR
jgi:O-antigen ligase